MDSGDELELLRGKVVEAEAKKEKARAEKDKAKDECWRAQVYRQHARMAMDDNRRHRAAIIQNARERERVRRVRQSVL
jgi:uncharacterized protein (DUF3084 family)